MEQKIKEELDKKVEELKKHFGKSRFVELNLANQLKFFKKDFNDKIFSKGKQCFFDLTPMFRNKTFAKRFDNNPIQPITITYKRCDLIFFKWNNYPKYEEEYFAKSINGPYSMVCYPFEVKKSELLGKKIKHLIEKKDFEELYIQKRVIDFENYKGLINIIDDLDYEQD